MRRLLLCAALLLVGCQSGPPPSGLLGPSGMATDEEGRFRLTFVVESTTVRPADRVVGRAQLALTAGIEAPLSGPAGGVLSFEFAEVGGNRRMLPVWDAACAPHLVRADVPLESEIKKSGSYSDDEPDAAFYREFFAGPDVRLPAGDWDVTAIAAFVEGEGCDGPSRDLRATIRIRVAG